jgi:hypothetical protein
MGRQRESSELVQDSTDRRSSHL